jgi:hypothetical protein
MLVKRGLTGIYAEIGVAKCAFARHFIPALKARKFKHLMLIDPWDVHLYFTDTTQAFMEESYKKAVALNTDVTVLRTTSKDAAENMENGLLDFVYIDAQHTYDAVREDLGLWYPKVKVGGVFAGHDYHMDEVQQAVREFAISTGHTINIINDTDGSQSWWIVV